MRLITLVCISAVLSSAFGHAATPLVKAGETIAFMGDSITQQGADSPGGYVHLVESGLAANDLAVKIIPAGIGGHKSDQMRARLEADVLSKQPAWMTLSCGVNDVWHGAKGVSLEDYKVNITDIVDRCQKAGVKVVILTSTQIGLPIDNPNNLKLAPYNDFLRALAKERQLPLADLNAAMAAEQDALKAAGKTTSLTSDGVHMSYLGNIMMARGVLRAFGLSDAQLAVASQKWLTLPDAVPLQAKCKISLAEMAKLEELALSRNQAVNATLEELLGVAVKNALAKAPAAQPAK